MLYKYPIPIIAYRIRDRNTQRSSGFLWDYRQLQYTQYTVTFYWLWSWRKTIIAASIVRPRTIDRITQVESDKTLIILYTGCLIVTAEFLFYYYYKTACSLGKLHFLQNYTYMYLLVYNLTKYIYLPGLQLQSYIIYSYIHIIMCYYYEHQVDFRCTLFKQRFRM